MKIVWAATATVFKNGESRNMMHCCTLYSTGPTLKLIGQLWQITATLLEAGSQHHVADVDV